MEKRDKHLQLAEFEPTTLLVFKLALGGCATTAAIASTALPPVGILEPISGDN